MLDVLSLLDIPLLKNEFSLSTDDDVVVCRFWYTTQRDTIGKLFGNTDRFEGIGVLIDTYDNDGTGLHPYAMLVFNDGTREFTHDHAQHAEEEQDNAGV